MDERQRAWGTIAGGALMFVGSFLPWVTVSTIFGTLTRSGVDRNGDGILSAGLGIAAAGIGVALLNRASRAASVALVAIAALAGLLVYVDASDIAGRLGDLDTEAALASIGIGLWAVGAGAMLTGVMGLQGLRPTTAPASLTATSRPPNVELDRNISAIYWPDPVLRLRVSSPNVMPVERVTTTRSPFLAFLAATKRACAQRTLESLARIELGAQGGALLERVTTTRISKSGVATTTVRERFTAPDWHADGWFWTGLGGRSSSC